MPTMSYRPFSDCEIVHTFMRSIMVIRRKENVQLRHWAFSAHGASGKSCRPELELNLHGEARWICRQPTNSAHLSFVLSVSRKTPQAAQSTSITCMPNSSDPR